MKNQYVSGRGYAAADAIFYELNEVASLVA